VFALEVPGGAAPGNRHGVATVHIEGLNLLRLDFVLEIGPSPVVARPLDAKETCHHKAFASYAHEDEAAVLARIQGIQKGAGDIDVFFDVMHLRSGDHWQDRLKEEILARDVLYLFWSEAASKSKWVDWEWRCGFNARGIDFIDPVPLVSPKTVPPPKELGDLHFNDRVLSFLASQSPSSGSSISGPA
jgi:TIR domain